MKTFQIYLLSFLFIGFTQNSFAQKAIKESFKVNGECGMCKRKIESAAKNAGATNAVWDVASKELTVTYNSHSSSAVKIQQSVASSGYDTPAFKAPDAAYNSLHECCQYDRAEKACCDKDKCEEGCCKKDASLNPCCTNGKCAKDMSCCKDGNQGSSSCCKTN